MTIGHPRRRAMEGSFIREPNLSFSRPISPAITEQLCKMNVTHEERAKSLKALVRDCCSNPNKYMPGVAMTEAERNAWASGFCEGMNVVLEYIKSGQPAPRG